MTEHDLPLLRPLPPELIRADGAANEPPAADLAPLELPADEPVPAFTPPAAAHIPLGAAMPDLRDIPVLHATGALPVRVEICTPQTEPPGAPGQPAEAGPQTAAPLRRSSLAAGMSFTGRIRLNGLFTLGGLVEGPVNAVSLPGAPSHVTVTPTGQVQGDISARNITVQGRTTGLLDAPGGRVSLHEGAVVEGRIRYGSLQVNGAELNAQLERVRPSDATPG